MHTFLTTVILRASKKEMFQEGTSALAFCLQLRVAGARPLGEVRCFVLSRGAGSQAARQPQFSLLLSRSQAGSQLHLQDFTTMLERCSTLGVLPT